MTPSIPRILWGQAFKTFLLLLGMAVAYGGLYLLQDALLADLRPTGTPDPGTDMMVALGRSAEVHLRERSAALEEERRRLLSLLESDPRRTDRTDLERRVSQLAADKARTEAELARAQRERAEAELASAAGPGAAAVLPAGPSPGDPGVPELSEALRSAEEERDGLIRRLETVTREAEKSRTELEKSRAALETERRAALAARSREQDSESRFAAERDRLARDLAAADARTADLAARIAAAESERTALFSRAGVNGVFYSDGSALRLGIHPGRSSEILGRGAFNVYPPGGESSGIRTKIFLYEENGRAAFRVFPGYPQPEQGDWF